MSLPINGNGSTSRKHALWVMSLLVIAVVIGALYFIRQGIIYEDGVLVERMIQFFETVGILIIGAFIAVSRELFNVGKTEPAIYYMDKMGVMKKYGGSH